MGYHLFPPDMVQVICSYFNLILDTGIVPESRELGAGHVPLGPIRGVPEGGVLILHISEFQKCQWHSSLHQGAPSAWWASWYAGCQ